MRVNYCCIYNLSETWLHRTRSEIQIAVDSRKCWDNCVSTEIHTELSLNVAMSTETNTNYLRNIYNITNHIAEMMKHKTQIVKCMNANATIICNLSSVFTIPHNKAKNRNWARYKISKGCLFEFLMIWICCKGRQSYICLSIK